VQNADSLSLFDDLDAALQSGSSAKRGATVRQVTDLLLSEADRLPHRGNQAVSMALQAIAGRNSREMALQRYFGRPAR
jgi:hypothetical protein